MGLETTRGMDGFQPGDGIAILSSMVQENLSRVTSEQKPEEKRENHAALGRRALKAKEGASAKVLR